MKSLQSICSPLALLLCGMVLAENDVRALAKLKYMRLPLIKTVAVGSGIFSAVPSAADGRRGAGAVSDPCDLRRPAGGVTAAGVLRQVRS